MFWLYILYLQAIALPQRLSQEKRAEENRAVNRNVKVAKTKPVVEKKEEVKLPQGNRSIFVAGIDLPPRHAGSVLQFLEFCSAFGKVLYINFNIEILNIWKSVRSYMNLLLTLERGGRDI